MDWNDELDAIGLLCPLPVLKARKRLKSLDAGQVLRLITTDPAALVDVPHFCNEQGHHILKAETTDTTQIYYIQKTN